MSSDDVKREGDLQDGGPQADSPQQASKVAVSPAAADRNSVVAAAVEATAFLESVVDNRGLLSELDDDQRARLLQAAGRVSRPDPWTKREFARVARRKRNAELRARDEQVLAQTQIRQERAKPVFVTPLPLTAPPLPEPEAERAAVAGALPSGPDAPSIVEPAPEGPGVVEEDRTCYVCKARYREIHFFYDSLCQACAGFNYAKRSQTSDLSGRTALLTGARVKIGYQTAIMMLRAGARVIVTTRFPRDAAARYAKETDFAEWGHRLQVYGLDLRHTPSVELFCRRLGETEPRLDFIINNACQTVRRPAGFYGHLLQAEQGPVSALSADASMLLAGYEGLRQPGSNALAPVEAESRLQVAAKAVGLQDPAALSQLALLEEDLERSTNLFPTGALDQDLQQVDLREKNSWRLPLAEVSAVELLEVQLVNAVAPFILNARLKPLMLRDPSQDKHVVNVSAMEGQFYRSFKTDKHPHTNMAKAALNMMTRTSARDYVQDGIHMNSVDTGWVTDEDAAHIAARKTVETGFHPPLDIVDGAARICDPIFAGFNSGTHLWGRFFKDYKPTDW